MRILLATDGSTNADAALDVVLYRPWENGTVIKVVASVEPPHDRINQIVGLFGLAKGAEEAQRRLVEHNRELLNRYAQKLKEKFSEKNVSVELLPGRARETIVAEAKKWNADLIILGAHGHSKSEESSHGGVSEHVLAHAPCSVEIIRFIRPETKVTKLESKQPIEENKYLIALDDSECSAATLEHVLSRKWPEGAFFNLISVAETLTVQAYSGLGPWEGAGSEEYAELVEKTTEAEHSAAEKILSDAAEKLRKKFPTATVLAEILEGYPKDRIVQFAREWSADMLILGSHGRSGFVHFMLGSVSKAATAHAPCSVLIVKVPIKM